jgi:hypothetical protein
MWSFLEEEATRNFILSTVILRILQLGSMERFLWGLDGHDLAGTLPFFYSPEESV